MDYDQSLESVMAILFMDFLESECQLEKVADYAVNGRRGSVAEPDTLCWYDESTAGTAVVSAAFHMLGQEILEQCSPRVTLVIVNDLIEMRNSITAAMKEGY